MCCRPERRRRAANVYVSNQACATIVHPSEGHPSKTHPSKVASRNVHPSSDRLPSICGRFGVHQRLVYQAKPLVRVAGVPKFCLLVVFCGGSWRRTSTSLLSVAQLFGMLVGHPHAFQAKCPHMLDKARGRLMITLIIALLLLVLEAEEGQAMALADFLSVGGSSLHIRAMQFLQLILIGQARIRGGGLWGLQPPLGCRVKRKVNKLQVRIQRGGALWGLQQPLLVWLT